MSQKSRQKHAGPPQEFPGPLGGEPSTARLAGGGLLHAGPPQEFPGPLGGELRDAEFAGGAQLTHFDATGQAHMVDVGAKAETARIARASGRIRMQAATFALIESGSAKKGDVLGIARIAAIQAAKRTADLIPLCHPIALTRVAAEFSLDEANCSVTCTVTAETFGRTGIEMEALTACAAGLLTIYDMCKAVDRGMVIEKIRLLEKAGGKSGQWLAEPG